MKKISLVTLVFVVLRVSSALCAQNMASNEADTQLPAGFQEIVLGQGMETVKTILTDNPYFDYRGDPDINMLLRPQEYLIECEGNVFITRAFFQFFDDRLYSIALVLDESSLDHYSMFTTLSSKYGFPAELDPSVSVWSSETVRLSLEKKPLTVKYLDKAVYESILAQNTADADRAADSRADFLGQF